MKFRKFAYLAVLSASAVTLAACGGNNGGTTATSLTVCLASEPQSIDPALNSAVDGATLLVHLDSGLYRFQKQSDGSLDLVYDLAKSITKETATVVDHTPNADGGWDAVTYENGTRYTVTLRDDIKWSDGTAITSDDFIYSWNRASGSTLGGDYCYMFETIADGLYHESDDTACPSLALNKVGDTVFTFDVMVDVPFVDQLLAFPTYFPVQKATVEANDKTENGTWATNPSTYVSCGAYKMTSWEHNSSITLEKNPDYWDAANIKLDKITFALSDDDSAMLASYKSGQYQMIDSVPNEQINELKEAYPNEFVVAGQMGTYYISFNVNSEVFSKADTEEDRAAVRRALGLFIDRQYIVDEIGKAGQEPANAFVSSGLTDPAGGEFVDHNGVNGDGSGYFKKGATDEEYNANVAEGIELLKGVGYAYDETEKKFTDFPAFKYLYNTSSGHQAIAENVKDTLARFGITVNLENQDWASFLETRKEGNYDVARNGWLADYDDPSSFLTMWTTQSGNNDSQFGRDAHATAAVYSADTDLDGTAETGLTWAQSYDVLMDKAAKESDATKRFKYLHAAETLLMSTGAICPIYYYTDIYMINSNINGFFSSPLGYKFFMYCTVSN
ncbi:MAG: peptide ABC transporter substrate-binding protein [Bacilli bacterium]|nr:peptide ABC transporter substrate-binding protein [Bacilli bacterium]